MTGPKLVTFPKTNIGKEIAKALRVLADQVENQELGKATNIAWIIDYDNELDVGLIGEAPDPLSRAYLLFGQAQRWIEKSGRED
jgi:hypothetical protein